MVSAWFREYLHVSGHVLHHCSTGIVLMQQMGRSDRA